MMSRLIDDLAGIRFGQVSDHSQERGFAAAGGPQDGNEFPSGDVEVEIFDDGGLAIEHSAYAGKFQGDAGGR